MDTTTFTATDGFPHPALVGVTGPDGTRAVQGDPQAVLPLASVTKPLTAWGVLVAVDRGLVDLDEPAGPAGATVLDLLDHTSGLPMEGSEPQRAPGERRIYSNAGFDALAAHVADAVGMDFADWMLREVTLPLGMERTDVTGRPSAGASASIEDLLLFGREVLRPTLIPVALRDRALTVSHPGLRGLVPGYGSYADNQWGLGFELKGVKSPHWLSDAFPPETAGQFGALGSFLFIDRSRDLAAAFLSGVPFGEEHKRIWPPLTDEIVARYGRS
ncbi:serine hydrolase domain-containing protein [Microbacterium capsulatum]|uniref:Serine hydrolase domain-containing protein n=1 Tax=Microbacterium capsulatum TaxID=3041921 RepID=A0ABU0XE81_9MICO|nr:serine hydrolase domain-containing protein [Microbacterium sp. ASV81]MDQ4213388.1 serine hydrolase domain-containing protein [Microbacterium sp. ASV81]